MARSTYPRSERHHALVAGELLAKHARNTGRAITLPVPIEMIVERTCALTVEWRELDEPQGVRILGALYPRFKRIVLNERHEDMFGRWVGPERFTLAHELAHWLYDADNPGQLALDFEGTEAERFCYHRESPGLTDSARIREVNANKLAAHLLLPDDLVRAADIDALLNDFRGTAARWGVSQQTLQIKLRTLGLIDELDERRLELL